MITWSATGCPVSERAGDATKQIATNAKKRTMRQVFISPSSNGGQDALNIEKNKKRRPHPY
jgi:hypothetical protein